MTRILGPAFLIGIVLGTLLPPFPLAVLALLLLSCLGLAAVGTRPVALGGLLLICRRAGRRPLSHHGDRLCRQSFRIPPRTSSFNAGLGGVGAAALGAEHTS